MNKTQITKDFDRFINIQSVSTDPNRFQQILEAVSFLKGKLLQSGFTVKIFKEPQRPPLIIASRIISSKSTTIGIYGHYDVQPEDPVEEWKTSPFKLTLSKGKFWGRGTADNKGHIIQNISAVENLINENKLKNNIVFILEGEEESGSVNFEKFIREAGNILSKVDVFFLTDVGMHWKNIPQIFYGLRGLVYFEIELTIGEHDLHSGVYGNRVYNPAQVLADLFVRMKDYQSGKILIPHFYDDVRRPDKEELTLLTKTGVTDEMLAKEAKVFKVIPTGKDSAFLGPKINPSMDINGIVSGYTGAGSKTIIPKSAHGKFSFRIVEHQQADRIEKMVKDFIKLNIPEGVKYALTTNSKSDPFYTSIYNVYISKTAQILKEVFGHETVYNRTGGSVPAAEVLQRLYKKPVVLTGFTLPDDNLHAPNENFDEEMFWKGIEALERVYLGI